MATIVGVLTQVVAYSWLGVFISGIGLAYLRIGKSLGLMEQIYDFPQRFAQWYDAVFFEWSENMVYRFNVSIRTTALLHLLIIGAIVLVFVVFAEITTMAVMTGVAVAGYYAGIPLDPTPMYEGIVAIAVLFTFSIMFYSNARIKYAYNNV